jgi:hypothetical protein
MLVSPKHKPRAQIQRNI